jgi:hypothetical protein
MHFPLIRVQVLERTAAYNTTLYFRLQLGGHTTTLQNRDIGRSRVAQQGKKFRYKGDASPRKEMHRDVTLCHEWYRITRSLLEVNMKSGVKTATHFIRPDLVSSIEAAVESVLGNAEPAWVVSITAEQKTSKWLVIAVPAGYDEYRTVLTEEEHSPEGIAGLLRRWYTEFQQKSKKAS